MPAPVIPLPFDGLREQYEKILEKVSSRIKIAATKEVEPLETEEKGYQGP